MSENPRWPLDAVASDVPTTGFGAPIQTVGLTTWAIWLAYLSSALTPWNGVAVLGLRPGDLVALVSLMAFGLADLGNRIPRLPPWAWMFGAVILLVTVMHEVAPTNADYLAGRTIVDAAGQPTFELQSNLTVGLKFLVPIIGLPLMYGFCALHDRRSLMRAAIAYGVGTAVSTLVAFSDRLGLSNLGPSLTTVDNTAGDRTAGFSVHPNSLAATCVISAAFALWMIGQRGKLRLIGLALTSVMLIGVYTSGSRGGAAVLGLMLVLAVVVVPEFRRHLSSIALFGAVVLGVLFVAFPSVGSGLLSSLRLVNGGESVTGSDVVRSVVFEQGVRDFKESPIDGVGMQVAAEAHNVYLQALASGGLLLLVGFLTFLLGSVVSSVRLMRRDPFALALGLATVASAVLSVVENFLVDRIVYVPMALIAALPNVLEPRLDGPDAPAAPDVGSAAPGPSE